MVLNLRQPNRRGFKSSLRETRRRKREYYYSAVSVLVVKIILFVFLCILLSVTTRVFAYRLADKPPVLRFAIPGVVLIAIVVLAYYIFNNIKDIRELSRDMRKQGPK